MSLIDELRKVQAEVKNEITELEREWSRLMQEQASIAGQRKALDLTHSLLEKKIQERLGAR